MRISSDAVRPLGLLLGVAADHLVGDPRHGHPVAVFGRASAELERRLYRDSRLNGLLYTACAAGIPPLAGALLERRLRDRPLSRLILTATVTWAVLGGRSLDREGRAMAALLGRGDLHAARVRLSCLCARDPADLGAVELARATVESLAENTSDAVVAPLAWGAVAGVPGMLAYRAANTLDAMVGYTSARYRRFGWASARWDDVLNLVPARLTGFFTVACAPVVGGSVGESRRILRRDAALHPSPNAGRPEAAAAGALGVRLGGENSYSGQVERRAQMGDGRDVEVGDVTRAARLARAVQGVATAAAVVAASWPLVRPRPVRR